MLSNGSNRLQMLYEVGVLKEYAKFTEKNMC